MSMAAIGITSLALTGISIGLNASGALSPDQPNLASSSAQLSNAKAQMLPFQREMEAAAAKGGDFTFKLPKGVKAKDYGFVENNSGQPIKQVKINGKWVPDTGQTDPGHGERELERRTIKSKGDGTYTVSFKGYGTADTQGKLAEQNAKNALALSKKYDSKFIDSALEQEKLADPEGVAARQRTHELITEQANQKPNHPVSDLLEKQVGEQLQAGAGLDRFDLEMLDRAVADATGARGGGGEGADYAQPLTTGYAGRARSAAGRRKALAFLSSGATPEDIDYRRNQQVMSNLASEVNGVTPQSQFASLSGAQNGPTPQVNGNPLPIMAGGTVGQAAGAAATGYKQAMSQPNQWMAGLSTIINAAGAAGKAGAFA